METPPKNGTFERHAISITAAIILTLLIWVGATVVDLAKSVVRLEANAATSQQSVIANAASSQQSIVELKQEIGALKTQVTVAALAAANAATAAALASLQQQQSIDSRKNK